MFFQKLSKVKLNIDFYAFLASWFFILSHVNTTFSHDFIDITEHGYEQYQDIIINNVLVKPASSYLVNGRQMKHDCESRYKIIKSILDKYERPFTVLDIGASQGYYSFKIAYDFNYSVCVMIEGDNTAYPLTGTQLEQLCYLNTSLNNVILLKRSLALNDIQMLSECEHFDVVLALNIIHWFPSQWRQMADTILNMGDNIIIETPPQEKKFSQRNYDIEQYILSRGAEVIGTVERHTTGTPVNIYLIKANKKFIARKNWFMKANNKHVIQSTFSEKKQIKIGAYDGKEIISDWLPGINLITFKMYSGTYPSKDALKSLIKSLMLTVSNNDCLPNNMIVQGNKVAMIDINDTNFCHGLQTNLCCDTARIKATMKWLDLDNTENLQNHFFSVLCKSNNALPK